MPAEQIPPDSNVGEVNARLNDGLKTCRLMVANYKALLMGEDGARRVVVNSVGRRAGLNGTSFLLEPDFGAFVRMGLLHTEPSGLLQKRK